MTQEVNVLVYKPGDLSSIPKVHMLGQNQLLKVALWWTPAYSLHPLKIFVKIQRKNSLPKHVIIEIKL